MTAPYQKPNHHRVTIQKMREWRHVTNTDRNQSPCFYCDEATTKTGHPFCMKTCGDNYVWVDTPTFAKIQLEDL